MTGTQNPDVLVVGLGAMGSAITAQLAKRGVKVVGVDQFSPPHSHGSTHGETRITREAIGEGQQFVPLAMRSHQLWREMERETGRTLFNACGGLVIAREDAPSRMHDQRDFLGNTFRAAEAFGIQYERLSASEISSRFPHFLLRGDECGYFEPGAGYLDPEACVSAQLSLASDRGATLNLGETVQRIAHVNGQTIVDTDRSRYAARVTIVAAGPWVSQLLPAFAASLTVRRQVLYWFRCNANNAVKSLPAQPLSYRPRDFPIFIWHWGEGADDVFYGFPEINAAGAIKVATEQCVETTTPALVKREVAETEITVMHARHIAGRLNGIGSRCVKALTCLYTNAPGANFVIDHLPDAPDTIVVSACSGHGFKHSAAIGEAVAEMAITRETPAVLQAFAIADRKITANSNVCNISNVTR